VLRFLQEAGRLDRLISAFGLTEFAGDDPTLLLWGYPVAGPLGESLPELRALVCDELGERQNGQSEPDVIVAWPGLLVFAETKTGSPNEILKGDARGKIDRYTQGRAEIFRASPAGVPATGYYDAAAVVPRDAPRWRWGRRRPSFTLGQGTRSSW
jgi:hypothetical protein